MLNVRQNILALVSVQFCSVDAKQNLVHSGIQGEIRTHTTRSLNPLPLPVGLLGHYTTDAANSIKTNINNP